MNEPPLDDERVISLQEGREGRCAKITYNTLKHSKESSSYGCGVLDSRVQQVGLE